MALSWNAQDEKPVGMIADRDLFLDKAGEKLAAAGSAESASLLIGKGREIDPADIARLGLVFVDGRVEQSSEEKAEEARTNIIDGPVSDFSNASWESAPESPGDSEG